MPSPPPNSGETNETVTTLTNATITVLTNVTVVSTNALQRDYYLYTELIPPPDFVLQSGESLVLLIDGVRHGFSPTNSPHTFIGRKGYISMLYKVPPQVLLDLAKAKEVRLRLKGNAAVIERELSTQSLMNFRKFVLKLAWQRKA